MSKRRSAATRGIGVDIGGSGIKGAAVDLAAGAFDGERVRIETPDPSTPEAVVAVVAEIVAELAARDPRDAEGPVGVTFPAVITHGVARTAANVDESWIGADVARLVGEATGRPVHAVNDADAAGVAEAHYGAAREADGVVLVATLGTGIGSALIVDGVLVPNTELGHLEIDGHDAERRASDGARKREDLSWEHWARRLQRYFGTVEDLLWPDLIVVGGGVSKRHEHFLPLLHLRAPIVPAQLRNDAGIIGAALLAQESLGV
ncbi:polyphosphate--glucose phosphotransferase [Allonocardiopsis opalescens]|uniref:Polyphosphate glucokinase n=1 Tax=Allonocardiopsis opalescens TaxID=1144618 RepID=A0A2T0PTY0_9ACTN|nr:ROK family protein [Allonocardiopsis opalescens]PRX92359.1 polyphosphate glucokinase [Allonocardiopsis opalescens]